MPDKRQRKGLEFDPRMLELLRRHTWDGGRGRILLDALSLRPDHKVVDVGCGTGAFTRVLAKELDAKLGGRIFGVDNDPRLLATAQLRSSEDGLDPKLISFREGDAKKLPFPDDSADRVVCQAVLWLMTDDERRQVLREMTRVCRRGGLVGAVEASIETAVSFQPGWGRLSELREKQYRAQLGGFEKLYGYDRNIGFKLPAWFQRVGLSRVRLDGIADVALANDDRIPAEHRVDEARYSRLINDALLTKVDAAGSDAEKRTVVEREEPVLVAGGMDWREIYELAKLYHDYSEEYLGSSERMRRDASVSGWIFFITTGIKA